MSMQAELSPEAIEDMSAIFDRYAQKVQERTLLAGLQDPATVAAICVAKIEAGDERSWPHVLDAEMAARGIIIASSQIETRRLRRATRRAIYGAQDVTTKPKTATEIIHALRLFAENDSD